MAAPNPKVVNLSSKSLTRAQVSLLSRGLKFCPTPSTPDIGLLREDLNKMHKRLRQIAFFEAPGSDTDLATLPNQTFVDTPNLYSTDPFKHRKFKNPAKGRGPIGPTNL